MIKRALISAGIVAVGLAVLFLLVRTRPQPGKAELHETGALVEVMPTTLQSHDVNVVAQGTVLPAREVTVAPEVSGRVVAISPQLVPGGRFARGEAILSIDSRDYALAVEQQRAAVDRAALDLELEKSRKVVAAREWQLLQAGKDDEPANPLALREPQVKTAEVALASANSALERAQLNLSRTTLRAPFDAVVQSEAVDVGQQIGPQTHVARLVGTEVYWVQVSVPIETLAWVRTAGEEDDGTMARVWQKVGRERIERNGQVVRLLPDVDPVGRMARLVVEIRAPLSGKTDALPLLLGSYVNVELSGPRLEDVVTVPRRALRDGDRVYVRNSDGLLETRDLEVAWRRKDDVLVSGGLARGEMVVTSALATPIPGMKLRLQAEPVPPDPEVAAGGRADGDEAGDPAQKVTQ